MMFSPIFPSLSWIPDLNLKSFFSHRKSWMISLHHILNTLWCHLILKEHFALRLLAYFWFQKVEWEVEYSAIRSLSFRTSSQFGFRTQASCLLLRLGLKLSFLIKLTFRAGSGDLDVSLSYAAGLSISLHSPYMFMPLQHIKNVCLLSLLGFVFCPHAWWCLSVWFAKSLLLLKESSSSLPSPST